MNVLPSLLNYGEPCASEPTGSENVTFVAEPLMHTPASCAPSIICNTNPCPVILNATCVFYEGSNLVYTGINTNDNLQTALQKIDSAISQFQSFEGNYVVTSTTLTINGVTYDLSASRTWSVGTVTSVGITMPPAFSVTNSPITTSGTLTVTGAGLVSQYVRGDGTLADFPGGGGGSSVKYYFNGGTNQGTFGGNTYYEMSKTAVIGTNADFSTAIDGYISQFITDPNDPALINIPGGSWDFQMYFSASSSGGSPSFYIELYKYDGATFTLIGSSSTTPEFITGGTSIDLYYTSVAVPATPLTPTDRLAVRFYVSCSGRTITLHTQDTHLCSVTTTFSTGITAINSLTDQVQYLTTGTAGTDFNILSAAATHTFNLPIASAVNTGKLSAADWTTFNNKPSGTGANGQVAYWTGASTQAGNNNLFWDNANNRLGINNNNPTEQIDLIGNAKISGYVSVGNGSILTPSINFINSINTGFFYDSTNGGSINFSLNGIILGKFNNAPSITANGQGNTFLGYNAGKVNFSTSINAYNNTFIGGESGISNTTGYQNTFIGSRSGFQNTIGYQNTFIGQGAGYENTTGSGNVMVGFHAGLNFNNTTTAGNTFVGTQAAQGISGSTGASNVIVGNVAGFLLTSGSYNSIIGRNSMYSITTGADNVAVGGQSGFSNTTGSRNIYIGKASGYTITPANANVSGSDNIYIGNLSGSSTTTQLNNTIAIGSGTTVSESNTAVWGNSSITKHIFNSGNIGINKVPSNYISSISSIEFGAFSSLIGRSGGSGTYLSSNVYFVGDPGQTLSNSRYINATSSGSYEIAGNNHYWFSAPIGIANNPIVWSQTMSLFSTGNLALGSTTDGGQRLQVYGDTLLRGSTSTNAASALIVQNSTAAVNIFQIRNDGRIITGDTSGNQGMAINGTNGSQSLAIGTPSGNASAAGGASVAIGKTTSSSQPAAVAIGSDITSGANSSIVIGRNMTVSGTNTIAIGRPTTGSHTFSATDSIILGTIDNQVVSSNTFLACNITNVFFGSGERSLALNGTDYTINGSGSGTGAAGNGGNIIIAGGKGVGLATPGDVIFSTGVTNTSAALQSLVNRWWVKGNTGQFANVVSPNASAVMQADSTTQGFLPPRMTAAQRTAITSPAEGLIVFQTDGTIGLYVYANATWRSLTMV